MKEIVVYSAKLCGDCQLLKQYLDARGMRYELRDIKENPAWGEELQAKTGKLGVPYVVVDGEWKRGYQPHEPFSESFAASLFQ